MKKIRIEEQNTAASVGQYSLQVQLGYASSEVKDREQSRSLVDQLTGLLQKCRPKTLYLHNPADKHDTHIAVLVRCLEALRRLAPTERPERVYGCEVWRDLDWLDDKLKVALPLDMHSSLASELIAIFESQVAGGKDYVGATLGRRRANATYFESHAVDTSKAYTFAMDLTPLLSSEAPNLADFVDGYVEIFKKDCRSRIQSIDSNI